MAHAGEEIGLGEVGLLRRALGLGQRLLDLPALGQVAGQLGESARVAGWVADGVQDDVGPEGRAVLAHAPALDLEAPLGGRRIQVALRHAAFDVASGIEAGEVLADDLFRAVALDPLGPGVPARDAAARVEHDDGAVGDALDHQPEAFLGPAQLFLHLLARGVVGADQEVADDPAADVAQGGHRDDGREARSVLADVGQLVLVLDPA